tara:strand:- start:21 stop:392 length:372 start_codon:yes stop_codon:yes gene_type:complete
MSEAIVERIADAADVILLERIAAAVERIADAAEKKRDEDELTDDTPFPWHQCSVRTRNCELRARKGEGQKHTCESLLKVGRSNICPTASAVYGKSWRNFGPNSLKEVDEVMDLLGFGDEWRST